ncbi:DNA mismatch repair protein MutS [Clostridium celatum]|mgnify:CR=1 FL=1|uniref:DNA mismatch repair protein MutS n=1 Tax=Clostridium celatum TaxID=36834 RepID=UPI001896AF51|nr:DNA mismatch repair protein MutS [Clostridium celatum]MDY3362193.1 DNA mismatch repair protein MutS [Clostridium celatum]
MALTPMMRQYMTIKENYQDCILFYRLGDFYEMFFDDAKTASRELELVLTGRECGLEERAPMCGIPFHAAANYISRLVSKGYKVAICEQVEDPAQAKGIVKRDVIKIITPGTFIENSTDEEYKNTYIMSIVEEDGYFGIASSDISTGEFKTTFFKNLKTTLLDEISKILPKEIVVDINFSEDTLNDIRSVNNCLITKKDIKTFKCDDYELIQQFSEVEVSGLNAVSKYASSILLKYILDTQKINLTNINVLTTYDIVNYMTIDSSSRRNLELTENIKEKSKKGSLIWVLDKTSTTMGGRTLRKWIEEPLISLKDINDRLDSVDELFDDIYFTDELRDLLKNIYDIERIVGKISNKNVNAKDLVSLNNSLKKLPEIKEKLSTCKSELLSSWYEKLDTLEDISSILSSALLEDPSTSVKEGNIIKNGYSEVVDDLREAKFNGKEWIASLENKEREFTGIKSLKIGYNKVFGYYIEISKANYSSIPEGRYIRKQTLANAERYITEELKVMEEKILGAEEQLIALEYKLFVELRDKVESQIPRLKNSANIISSLDAITTLAKVAMENDYIRPNINNEGIIDIKNGRHPVVEKVINNGEFVSNDTYINKKENRFLLITGPNMAGKSTYMRQVALITLMAQIGSFVPASYANISVCDKIFTRIGASDDLAGGKSTFMVEMWEVSNILKNATSDSLVLLDEVGRGTSTYDGLSIAWSVIEYISNKEELKCNTLFATHYHELTKLEGIIEGVKNYSVAVKETNEQVVFLRKIVEGGADQSYGIEVAKLAGLPKEVINRAKVILAKLEKDKSFEIDKLFEVELKEEAVENEEQAKEEVAVEAIESNDVFDKENYHTVNEEVNKFNESKNETIQMDFSMIEKEALIKEISNIEVMMMTPLDAMNTLFKIVQDAKKLK